MNETQKWTTQAGPRQTKQVDEVLREVRRQHQMETVVRGVIGGEEHRSTYWSPFGGGVREDVTATMAKLGDKYGWKITRENYQAVIADAKAELAELVKNTPVKDERETPEAVSERDKLIAEADAKRKAEAEAQAKIDAENETKWREEFAYLEEVKHSSLSPWALAAKNIRSELMMKYPGIVGLTVKSKSYSGGCSIDVGWQDGPTEKEIYRVVEKYKTASFDGMTDMESGCSTHWNAIYGGAKYISAGRSPSAATLAAVMPWAQQRAANNDLWCQYNAEGLAHRLIALTSLPVGAVVTGVEARNEAESCCADNPGGFWRIVYTVPETKTPADPAASTAPTRGVTGVDVCQNEEKDGVELRFPSRPDQDILETLKARGWRWSRFAKCWYHKRNAEAIEFANNLAKVS
jgi:hypothetical protein